MNMKKLTTLAVAGLMLGSLAFADNNEWTGTKVGANTAISDKVEGGIAIGDGADDSCAIVTASGACQIGKGTNRVANTIKFRDKYIVLSNTNGGTGEFSAAQLTAGTSITAVNLLAGTNVNCANLVGNILLARWTNIANTAAIKLAAWNLNACTNYPVENLVGTTLPAVSGANLTSLASANLAGNIALARWTNIANTAGVTVGAWNINACTNVPAGNLVGTVPTSTLGGLTFISTNWTGVGGVTNLLYYTNGLLGGAHSL